ncbi:MAG: tetratricopeptide repeat protein [Deltaproteobacteria bacterium]|nr:tetratricopeptide repeat protein [Deltaproteobacteria bacterium]
MGRAWVGCVIKDGILSGSPRKSRLAAKINKGKVIAAAQKYVQKGQYDKAIREYSKVVEENPRDVRVWLKIGDLYAKRGAREEAIDTYLKVAEFYSEQGFFLKAVAVYKQILKLNPNLVDVSLKLAELYRQLGLLNDAIQHYERVSNHYHQAGMMRDTLSALCQIVELDPENVAIRIKLAELYSKEQMRAEAVEAFTKAADFLRASNRLDDFIKVAERLVYHQADNVALTKELASLYLRRNDPRRALQKLQIAFKADARAEDTLEMLAQAFHDLGKKQKTISVWRELAHIHEEAGQKIKLMAVYERILDLAPEEADIRQALATVKNLPTGEHIAASPASPPPPPPSSRAAPQPPPPPPPLSKPFLATGPQQALNEPISAGYGGALEAPQVYEELQAGKIQEVEVEPEVPALPDQETLEEQVARVFTEAEVYIKYGLTEKAADHLRQIFVRDPGNVEVHLQLRDLFVQDGRYVEGAAELYAIAQQLSHDDRRTAAQYLNEALELDPQHEAARQLLLELETAGGMTQAEEPRRAIPRHDTSAGTFVEGGSDAIDLDASDIVEEIPLDSNDLLVGSDTQTSHELDYVLEAGEGYPNTGVLELQGELTDTLGGVTPSSEVILLASAPGMSDTQRRAQEEEQRVTSSLEDELEEADFFIQQNLFIEAHEILDRLMIAYPGHPLVEGKRADLQHQEGEEAQQGDPRDSSVADIVADLADSLDEMGIPPEERLGSAPAYDAPSYDAPAAFHDFKKDVDEQVSEEDSDTHYDLGIAYREMGLIDDAIEEFRVAMRSKERHVLCHMMIGLCYASKEMPSEAISEFKTGLYVEGISERETVALYYELGQIYNQLEDPREAHYYFEKVAKKDPNFRDARAQAQQLAKAVGEDGGESSGHDDALGAESDAHA